MTPWNDRATDQDFIPERETAPPVEVRQVGRFTCDHCGKEYPKAWTDEEAMAEALGMWTEEELANKATVCDDCYRAIMPAISTGPVGILPEVDAHLVRRTQ
jgi:hypothetical protein